VQPGELVLPRHQAGRGAVLHDAVLLGDGWFVHDQDPVRASRGSERVNPVAGRRV
jgi:cell wall-associated NlpC family hydrolase